MAHWWWSWALAGLGVIGLWVAGSGRRIGWLFGIATQMLWVAYALGTRQYGFLISAFAYALVYTRNWLKAGIPLIRSRRDAANPAGGRSGRERRAQSGRISRR